MAESTVLGTELDLVVIGGGINGTGIALDAAGRGLRVALIEQQDLASGTSSASSGFIHGGLRYLEQYEFKLVRQALAEREILWHKAPHLIRPLTFVLPHAAEMRPAWLLRLGLWLYDHLARRQALAPSTSIQLSNSLYGQPLKADYRLGFAYTDCQVDDARLVIANALTARAKGALILPRWRFAQAEVVSGQWRITTYAADSTIPQIFYAKALVNAAGPWVTQVRQQIIGSSARGAIRLVKGSHIVVPQLYTDYFAYILQNTDKRVTFIAPYHGQTMIGTTDVDFNGNPAQVAIDQAEIAYLCQAVNRYLRRPLLPSQIIHHWSGLRALYDDGVHNPAEVTRDYYLESERIQGCLLISVFGGKLTTYRALAEAVLQRLATIFPQQKTPWTATAPLVGGELGGLSWQGFCQQVEADYPQLPSALLQRYIQQYGSEISRFLTGVVNIDDLGARVAGDLYAHEIHYLQQHEWALTAEDILWRRTKLGLMLSSEQQSLVSDWLAKNP